MENKYQNKTQNEIHEQQVKQSTTSRRVDIQIIRILSMFMIVLCHIIDEFTFIPGSALLPQVFNVGVYTFFSLSGYLYGSKTISNFPKWFIGRLKRIALPALIVSFVTILSLYVVFDIKYSFLTYLAYGLNLQGLSFIWSGALFYDSIDALGGLWFITVILICSLLTPLFQALKYRIKSAKSLALIVILLVFIRYALIYCLHIEIIYFIVYFIGYELSSLNIKFEHAKKHSLLLFTLGVFLLQAIRVLLQIKFDGTFIYSSYANISHTALGLWILSFGVWLCGHFTKTCNKLGKLKILSVIDEYSFYIYLTHGIFCSDVFAQLNLFKLDFPLLPNTIFFLMATIISSIALKYTILGIEWLLKRLFGRK